MKKENHHLRACALRCLMRWEQGGIFAETLVHREGAGRKSALYIKRRYLKWIG